MSLSPRARRLLVAALALPLGLVGSASFAAGTARAPDPGLERSRAESLEKLFLREGPSVPLSAAYASLPEPARHALLEKLRAMVLAHLPPGIENHPGLEALPPEARPMVLRILPLLRAVTPAQMDAFVRTQDLDHLAPLPAAATTHYHRRALGTPAAPGGEARARLLEAHRKDPESWRKAVLSTPGYLAKEAAPASGLELLGPDDPVPTDEIPRPGTKPALGGLAVNPSFPLELPGYALVNSKRLAQALNHLTVGRPLPVTIGDSRGMVREGVELVNRLLASGRYDLGLYDARMFVNFIDPWVPHGESLVPVRVPTWLATGIDPKAPEGAATKGPGVLVPANHAEHLLVLFEAGTERPAALVRWFIGIPSPELAQGAAWRPAIDQRASWSGYRIVRAWRHPTQVRQMVRAADLLMRLFNWMQGSFAFDRNGYGVLGVCNDTSGLLETILSGRVGESTVWPLLRAPELDFYYAAVLGKLGLRLQSGGNGLEVLAVPSDARPDLYPWTRDRSSLLYRIGANVPTRDPASIQLPSLREAAGRLAGSSPAFARGLQLLSVSGAR